MMTTVAILCAGGLLGGSKAPIAFDAFVKGVVVWSPSSRLACVSQLGRRSHFVRAPRTGLRVRAESESSDDDDVLGQNWPSYNNVPDDDVSASDGAPQFTKESKTALAFGGVAQRLPSALSQDDMTEGLKERVYYVMLDAFDNYPPQEVSRMLDLLWAAGPGAGPTQNSVRQLVQLTAEVEAIAKASRDRSAIPGSQFDDLLDSLQVARSRVRMNAKDADMYDPQTTTGMLKRLSDDAQAGNGAWDASALWGFVRSSDGKSKAEQEQTSGEAGDRGSEERTRSGRRAWWWPFQ